MRIAVDNSSRIEYLRTILQIAFWPSAALPLPHDMQALLLAIDADEIENDLREAYRLDQMKPATLQLVK